MISQNRMNGHELASSESDDGFELLTASRAERSLVSSCLLDRDQFDQLCGTIAEFHLHGHLERLVWGAMTECRDSGAPFDPVSITERVAAIDGMTNPNRIAESILQMFDDVYRSYNASTYAAAVLRAWKRRELSQAGLDIQRLARDPSIDPDEAIGRHADRIAKLSDGAETGLQSSIHDTIAETLHAAVDGVDRVISTGFPEIAKFLNLRPGQLVTVAARPAVGKTAFGCCVMSNIAQSGVAVGFVSLEMSRRELETRLLSRFSRVPVEHMRNANAADRFALAEAANELSSLPIVWDDRSNTIDQVIGAIRRMKRSRNCQVVVLDYLQLIAPTDSRLIREQQIAGMTRRLKSVARELEVCIVMLSQLSRAMELRTIKTPQLSDLRESGSIEQDSDAVVFLHKPGLYDANEPDTKVLAIVAKHRGGPTGVAELEWHGWCCEFVSRSEVLT